MARTIFKFHHYNYMICCIFNIQKISSIMSSVDWAQSTRIVWLNIYHQTSTKWNMCILNVYTLNWDFIVYRFFLTDFRYPKKAISYSLIIFLQILEILHHHPVSLLCVDNAETSTAFYILKFKILIHRLIFVLFFGCHQFSSLTLTMTHTHWASSSTWRTR